MLAQRARLTQPARFERQGFVLARHEPRGLDLARDVAQVIGPATDLIPLRGQYLGGFFEFLPAAPLLLQRCPGGQRIGIGIENVALGVCVQQRLGLVLAMEIHQHRTQIGENTYGGGAAVDPGTRAAFGGDLTPDDHAALIGIESQLLQLRERSGRELLEHTLDDAACRAGANLRRIGALAQQEGECIHQHGLAGPGFAGEDIEAWTERQGDIGNGGEVAHPQLGDHRWASRSDRSPQWSLWRIRANHDTPSSRTSLTR